MILNFQQFNEKFLSDTQYNDVIKDEIEDDYETEDCPCETEDEICNCDDTEDDTIFEPIQTFGNSLAGQTNLS